MKWCHYCGFNNRPYSLTVENCCYQCECENVTVSAPKFVSGPYVKPSIGRIVLYNHPGSAGGTYPPTQSPAIVQKVHEDDSVDLWVFGPKGLHKDGPYKQGDGPCQWNWPPRV